MHTPTLAILLRCHMIEDFPFFHPTTGSRHVLVEWQLLQWTPSPPSPRACTLRCRTCHSTLHTHTTGKVMYSPAFSVVVEVMNTVPPTFSCTRRTLSDDMWLEGATSLLTCVSGLARVPRTRTSGAPCLPSFQDPASRADCIIHKISQALPYPSPICPLGPNTITT